MTTSLIHCGNALTYGSVCSGVEAASLAWEPLGMIPLWFAEIEKFPSAVLQARWPDVPNLGDMTEIADRIRTGEIPAPDVLVGGTPCQAFSLAGLREGLDDPRGLLTLKFVELADAIDSKRAEEGKPPCIVVWENVPGVLSSHDNAFGNFTAGLAGENEAFEPGDRPETGKSSTYWAWNKTTRQHVAKWPKYGCIIGPRRRLAWGIKDAQYYGVAQRRQRTFIVASARTDFDSTKILFEPEGVCRDSPPSREAGAVVAPLTASGIGTSGADPRDAQAGHIQPVVGALAAHSFTGGAGGRPEGAAAGHFIPTLPAGKTANIKHNLAAFGGGNCGGSLEVAACLTAKGQRIDFEVETFIAQSYSGDIAHTLRGEGFDGSEDGTGRGIPLVPGFNNTSQGWWSSTETAAIIREGDENGGGGGTKESNVAVIAFPEYMSSTQTAKAENISPTLMARNPTAIAFSSKDRGSDATIELSPTLRAGNSDKGNANAGAPPAVVIEKTVTLRGREGGGTAELGDEIAGCLRASTGGGDKPHVLTKVSFVENNSGGIRPQNGDRQISGQRSTGGVGQPVAVMPPQLSVRRLTPVECERLQGFPDNHTLIPVNKRNRLLEDELAYLRTYFPDIPVDEANRLAADGPRYKAIGNSMAVPVMRWLGARICEEHLKSAPANDDGHRKQLTYAPLSEKDKQRPFLRWAGGKFSVLDELAKYLPAGDRLIEPFVGGGSVFINFDYPSYLLADVNDDLINLYRQLTHYPRAVITSARQLVEGCKTNVDYKKIRDDFNARYAIATQHAALFLAINRTCFNGLSRYNNEGIFNVGWNKKDGGSYFPESELQRFTDGRANREFLCASFDVTIARAGAGDVVYCDPPYEPLPGTTGFVKYDKNGFTFEHQAKLADELVKASQRGAKVVITNSCAPNLIDLYESRGFKIHELKARRAISCKASTRETASDIIATL